MGMFDADDYFEYGSSNRAIVDDVETSKKKLAELIRITRAYTLSPEGTADYLVNKGVRVLANHKPV